MAASPLQSHHAASLAPSPLSTLSSRASELLHILAAAIRAARAVEARHDPHPADLKRLGIDGKLPKTW